MSQSRDRLFRRNISVNGPTKQLPFENVKDGCSHIPQHKNRPATSSLLECQTSSPHSQHTRTSSRMGGAKSLLSAIPI
jgi:hypothetical protein